MFRIYPNASFLPYVSLTIDVIQCGFTGGNSILLFASNTVSGLSVLSLTVNDSTLGKYNSSSCIDPESVISAQQCPLSKNSITCAYSFHRGVIMNLSGNSSARLCNLDSMLYSLSADLVAFNITRFILCSVLLTRVTSASTIDLNLRGVRFSLLCMSTLIQSPYSSLG